MTDPRVVPLHLSDVTFPHGHPLAGSTGPVLGFAVVHDDGVLLFDSGVGTGNPEVDEYYRPRVRPIADALAEHGISTHDVTAIANSHLHFDHVGANRTFAGLPAYAQAAELELAPNPEHTIVEWVGLDVLRFTAVPPHEEAEIAPGAVLIATPGHTPGHQSLVLDTAEGPVVLVGQALYSAAEWEGSTDPRESGVPNAPDVMAYSESIHRLRRLDPVRMHFAHDLAVWERGRS